MAITFQIAQALVMLFRIYSLLLFVWVILSWLPQLDRRHPVVLFVANLVEPTVAPFRRLLPLAGGIDLSPMVAFLVYQLLVQLAVKILLGL